MAPSYSDTEHSPSNYTGSYPSLSDSASSLHLEPDMHSYESPEFGIQPRQPPHGSASTSLPSMMHVSNSSPQNFLSLQEYVARLEKENRDMEQKHLLLETQHNTLR